MPYQDIKSPMLTKLCLLALVASNLLRAAAESLPPLIDGKPPQTFEALWAGYDPRTEPLQTEVLKEWEEDGVVLRVVRYQIGVFKGQKTMMAAVYGFPKGGRQLPGLVQIHGGGQFADYKAALTNAKRGYATISLAWAGRISAPGYAVNSDIVNLFIEGKTDDPAYKVTTDWHGFNGYHAVERKNRAPAVFPEWKLDEVADSPRNSTWFMWEIGARRALTFLEQQPEVNPAKLGVYGHSMGGKLTVMTAAADPRVKAAAPSCGGVSARPAPGIAAAPIDDGISLAQITCPIIFLNPANDFHAQIDDLQTALTEIHSHDWRVTCSAHGNHQDLAEFEVATQLWFDQWLLGTFQFPMTPAAALELKTANAVPCFTVTPDASRDIHAVDIYYSQQGRTVGTKAGMFQTMNRFWHRAKATRTDATWTAELPLLTIDKPLWVYANVLYALDQPVTGAGYYYGKYTAQAFNLSSRVTIVSPAELKAAGVRATTKPSLVIEAFDAGWEKEWFTYDMSKWARSTHKLYDPQWPAPEGALLALEVRSTRPNKLVVGLDDHAAEVALAGGSAWQRVELSPAEFRSAKGPPLPDWKGITTLRLGPQETLKATVEGLDKEVKFGAEWQGARPEFKNLRWLETKSLTKNEVSEVPATAVPLDFSDPAQSVQAPAAAAGFPRRDGSLDVLPGFKTPPVGYGEVPYWWWTGGDLDADRMIWQLQELHKKGISGVQVNYSHHDSGGWMTDQDKPAIFTDEWWKVYSKVSDACAKMDMGIGMSTYTIDWPNGAHNLFYELFYRKPELNAIQLETGRRQRVNGGAVLKLDIAPGQFAVRAYPVKEGKPQRGGVDLTPFAKDGKLDWNVPDGEWEIWTFHTTRKAGSFNPLMAGSGATVIKGFFQPFQDHNRGNSAKGLNYFFNDELQIGVGKFAWNPDFAAEFRARKGYDLMEVLPAMWSDMGDMTPKVRMDYADVRMALMEERYFQPIYAWHVSRGMIFAADSCGRGRSPNEFGDYFRATRWYSAPGHDTPGGNADLIKGKVSSSVANLYQRPRVWLEGYHSLGWGAAPERLMHATRENYLYGCTLLNLHGFYYTTYGSHWEWAPPCYHFRMPYWAHMGVFLGYFDRLSYLMSQGNFACDVAVVYPVAPYEAEMNGDKARNAAFELGERLMAAGINFEFIDNDSLARATVANGRLVVKSAGASYQALVVPDMDAVRWQTIEKAAAFAQAGGKVYNVGAMPAASDHAGRNDPELTAVLERAFQPDCRFAKSDEAVTAISKAFVQDVRGLTQAVRALHRKAGPRDIYLVMDAKPGGVVEFRCKGAVDLWDPWSGKTTPLRILAETATGTQVELPLESYEAQVVVFTPGQKHRNPPPKDERPLVEKALTNEWSVAFVPTMDNTYGDFRMPVTTDNKQIGLEARRFAWAPETETLAKTAMLPTTDDSQWKKQLHGYGPQFYVLGPLPDDVDGNALEAGLCKLKAVDLSVPVPANGKQFTWHAYEYSWRMGKEGDQGHQGFHGLKRVVTDDFLCLGKSAEGHNETRYEAEPTGQRYYLWTCATVAEATTATILVSREEPADKSHTSKVITPAAVYLNGAAVADIGKPVSLKAGANPLLVRYDQAGRGHFVMRRNDSPAAKARTPLSMRWNDDPGLILFDVSGGAQTPEWFRFVSAPGTNAITVHALGTVQAWLNGAPMKEMGNGRFVAANTSAPAAAVALRVIPQPGSSGGAVIPEPAMIETDGSGVMALGDWSKVGILNNYSGGTRYTTTLSLTKDEAKGNVMLDLGSLVATAEIHLNGNKVAVLVAPPWKTDVTGFLRDGENKLEVLVYNTLANHYQTIPSRYRGNPVSGLLGPVRLLSPDWK